MHQIIDLTYEIHSEMIKFNASWHEKTQVEQMGFINQCGRQTSKIVIGSHAGTHMDAPLHFIEGGKSIDEIALDKLMGPVTVCDLSFLKDEEPIKVEDLQRFNLTKRVIFKTGWGKNWGNDTFYKGYPYIPLETARYIYEQGVEVLAMDMPSPDDSHVVIGSEQDSAIHKYFLEREVVLIEYVANLKKVIDYENWHMVAAPLKLRGIDGSPIRMWIYR